VTRTLPDRPPTAAGLPRHRAIVAVDIEQSTSRPDTVKADLRRTLYDLFGQALRSAGIHRRHRDRFTDRGDGLLALIHPVDQVSKPVLLNRAVPALSQLLAGYNASLPRTGHPHHQPPVFSKNRGLGSGGLSRGRDLVFSGFMPGGECRGGAPDGCGGPVRRCCAGMAVSAAKSAPVLGDYAVTTPVISRPERSSR